MVDLHPELRKLVDEMLSSGYLSAAEAAFQAGLIDDYFLFPAGEMRTKKAGVEQAQKQPIGPKALRVMFLKLETLAGVEHQPGRAFYGLRRQATDLAPEFSNDDRVLDRVSGQKDSETRKNTYQDRQKDALRAKAATVRQSMRKHLLEQARKGGADD